MESIGERIVGWMGGVTRSEMGQRVSEAYASGYNDGGEDEPVSGTTAKYGYRRAITQGLRDFHQMDYDTILQTVWTLWQSNPVSKRVLGIKRGYICGHGIAVQSDDEELQIIIDKFIDDNRMHRRFREFTQQLFLFGCQCYPVFVRKSDGRVRLGYIDPEQIEAIIPHPENAMEMWAIVVKEQSDIKEWESRRAKRVYRIIRQDEGIVIEKNGEQTVQPAEHEGKLVMADQATLEPWEHRLLKAYGLDEYSGSCFYEKVNSVSNQPHGYSDLLQVADWIDQHDETLFALADREQMAGYFSWDVTLEEADEAKVKARSQELRAKPPKKGSVNVHNDKEVWSFNYPDLKQNATIETQNALLTNILGGLGVPRHWYGYGDETNRATAAAQGDPTWRTLEDDQDIVRELIGQMMEFVRDQAAIAGSWKISGESTGEITVTMPEMTSKDLGTVANALGTLAMALSQAEQEGWIAHDTAAKVWAKVLAEIDIEIDVNEELAKVAKEIEDSGEPEGQDSWFTQHAELTDGEETPTEVPPDLLALFAGAQGAES